MACAAQHYPHRGILLYRENPVRCLSTSRIIADACSYIIEELVAGGDLLFYISRNRDNGITANEACVMVFKILQALEYLHGFKAVHRDVKPESVLMSTTAANARVILTDFGHSTKFSGKRRGLSRRMKTVCGTLDFVAP